MKKLFIFIMSIVLVLIPFSSGVAQDYQFASYNLFGMELFFDTSHYYVNKSDEKSMTISDKDSGLFVEISAISLGNQVSNEEFEGYITQASQTYKSIEDQMNTDFQFGSDDSNLSETNMRILYNQKQTLFGTLCPINIYSIQKTDKNSMKKNTTISIIIPDQNNKTIFMLVGNNQYGTMNKTQYDSLKYIINSLSINKTKVSLSEEAFMSEDTFIKAFYSSAYASISENYENYSTCFDLGLGYIFVYPGTYKPYIENTLSNEYTYKSFKIDYRHSTSFLAYHTQTVKTQPAKAIEDFKHINLANITIDNEYDINISGKIFHYIKYHEFHSGEKVFFEDYYYSENNTTYIIQLKALLYESDELVKDNFLKILGSFTTFKNNVPQTTSGENKLEFATFIGVDNKYRFEYPSNWEVEIGKDSVPEDTTYNIINPDVRSGISLQVLNKKITNDISYDELINTFINNPENVSTFVNNYSTPFLGRKYKLLSSRIYDISGKTHLERLINYIDDSGRSRSCVSIDIFCGNDILTINASVADYWLKQDMNESKDLISQINHIVNSFSLHN